jgi:hypothetical protein
MPKSNIPLCLLVEGHLKNIIIRTVIIASLTTCAMPSKNHEAGRSNGSGASAGPLWQVLVLDPEGLAKGDVFEVKVSGQVVGVAPALFEAPTAKQLNLAVSSIAELGFYTEVTWQADGLQSGPVEVYGCRHIGAGVRINKDKDNALIETIAFTLHKSEKPCRESGGMSVPENKAVFTFISDPPESELVIANLGTGKTVRGKVPFTAVLHYECDDLRNAVFKREGYLDCVLPIAFKCDPEPHALVSGQRFPIILAGEPSDAPNLKCTMKKIDTPLTTQRNTP